MAGLEAGADDYVYQALSYRGTGAGEGWSAGGGITAQPDRARHRTGCLARVKYLRGLLPICAYCKKIRNDHNYWQQVEVLRLSIPRRSSVICPECYEQFAIPALERVKASLR